MLPRDCRLAGMLAASEAIGRSLARRHAERQSAWKRGYTTPMLASTGGSNPSAHLGAVDDPSEGPFQPLSSPRNRHEGIQHTLRLSYQ